MISKDFIIGLIIVKTTFIFNFITSTIILSIITPIEIAIITYFGVGMVKHKGDKK